MAVTSDETDQLVTIYLEMRAAEQLRPRTVTSDKWKVARVEPAADAWRFNRDMYCRVGEPWGWFDKRGWTDEQWKEYANSPEMRTFAAYYDGELAGYYELRRDAEAEVEIAYFGLLPESVGRGLGGALLTHAIEEAWRISPAPRRVWVHTCNRDHPQALANYQARGMSIYKVERGEPTRKGG
jgi:GNAT superfamily N-acetyltransferase